MTLRQHLAAGKYQAWYWLLSVCYIIGGVAVPMYLLEPVFGPRAIVLAVPSIMLMFLLGPQLFRLIRCPRCSARLGALGYWAVTMRAMRSRSVRDLSLGQIERLGKCPHCGLGLDEQIPQ